MEATFPTQSIKNHHGTPVEQQSVFFVQPHPSIGEIISATSNVSEKSKIKTSLYEKRRRFRLAKKWSLNIGLWFLLLVQGPAAVLLTLNMPQKQPILFWSLIFVPVLAIMGLTFIMSMLISWLRYKKHAAQCTYVGKAGLQRSGIHSEILRFSDVRSLLVKTNLDPLVPEAVSYVFLGQNGQSLLNIHVLESSHHTPNISSDSSLFFARQAETVWCSQKIEQIEGEISARGLAWIDIGPKVQLGIGKNQLFLKDGTVQRSFSPELGQASISLNAGMFEINIAANPQENLPELICFIHFSDIENAKVVLYVIQSVAKIPLLSKPGLAPGDA